MSTNFKFKFTLIVMLAFSVKGFAQNEGDIVWKKHFGGSSGDYYNSVTAVSDGIIAVGSSYTTSFGNGDWAGVTCNGWDDAIIVKYDNVGNVIWKKHFGGSDFNHYNSVTAVSDGIIAVGYSGSFGTGDWADVTGNGDNDAIIVKYDNAGNVVWKKNFGGSGRDHYNSVIAVSDGIIAVGHSESLGTGDWAGITGKGNSDAIIVKYDSDGNIIWKKNFGGNGYDFYESITAAADGIIAVGYVYGGFGTGDWAGIAGKGGDDAIIVKYDTAGNIIWKKNFGGSSTDKYNSVTTVSDGIIAAGLSHSTSFGTGDWEDVTENGGIDAIIVKYDNNGNVIWKKNFGGDDYDCYFSVTSVSNNIIAVGFSYTTSFGTGDWEDVTGNGGESDATIVKYDSNGDVIWKKNFGGNSYDLYSSVISVSDGIIVVGNSDINISGGAGDWVGVMGNGDYDATIVKYKVSTVGIVKTVQGTGLQVYPNPTTGQLRIANYELRVGAVIEIYDVVGRLYTPLTPLKGGISPFEGGRGMSEIVIDISHLANGMYFLKIDNKVMKFVKQ